eukprot:6182261-Pleurochrysis_carterae.AAC.1
MQLEDGLDGRVHAVFVAHITSRNAKNARADKLGRQSHAVGNFDAHVRPALRDAVGGEEAAIAACCASGSIINESHSRSASSASWKRIVGHCRGCSDDWHCVGALKEDKKYKEQCRTGSGKHCTKAVHKGDARQDCCWRDDVVDVGVFAHIDILKLVGPSSVRVGLRWNDAEEVGLPVVVGERAAESISPS